MSWFADILGNWKNEKTDEFLSFGRFSDAYKTPNHYKNWDLAVQKFSMGEISESYEPFFKYLGNDQDNVHYTLNDEVVRFDFYQGSKKIEGLINQEFIRAEAKIAKTKDLHLGYMRLLVERNYGLKYTRFALDDEDVITIVFDSHVIDCSPFKLYYALKELAIMADKLDDIMVDEFVDDLEHINTGHIVALPPEEIELKSDYLLRLLGEVTQYFAAHEEDPQVSPGGLSYVLLAAGYKIDYIAQPEAYLLEAIERIQRIYFKRDDMSMGQKNLQIIQEYERILERGRVSLSKEFYRSVFTFGITKPAGGFRIIEYFQSDWNNFLWYKRHQLDRVAISICEYMVGYSLFNYAPPQPIRELLHLYMVIIENSLFLELGYEEEYWDAKGESLRPRQIKRELKVIEDRYEEQFDGFEINMRELEFDSLLTFSESFIVMINELILSS